MPGFVLTSATVAGCPHGGQASFVPTQSHVLADSSPVLLATDQATIAGCPFVIGTVASPCVTIRWSLPTRRLTVTNTPVLLSTSVGLCLNPASAPQGLAIISSTQTRVQAT